MLEIKSDVITESVNWASVWIAVIFWSNLLSEWKKNKLNSHLTEKEKTLTVILKKGYIENYYL